MKILFIDTVHPLLKEQLEKIHYKCDTAYNKNKSEIETIIHNYDGIIIRSKCHIDEKFIKKATNLKFIARAGSGLENIDVPYAESKNIKCYNAAEGNKQAVAEHALGMLLSLFNNLNKSDVEVRKGKWKREENRGIEIAGKKIGIIGYGNNGSAFAEILQGFKVDILAYDKYLKKHPYKTSMKIIYEKADILSLHIPLTKETTYLINNNLINNFQKDFYLINTARGKCVNTKDLVSALKNGKIKGACLDVLEYENTSFEKINKKSLETDMKYLINSNKVLLSPHIAGWTVESSIKIAKILFQKITSDFVQ
ncbi:MAG: NAD(P)-dependent oxidoreductase [Bacteroidota bacterium]|nr:NAD(P)-dependent oxidoreductase [Bacteroidota bacterium]